MGPLDEPGAGGKVDDVRDCAQGRNCLEYRSWEVLFTNPLCENYPYDEPVSEVDDERDITAKPKNIYCDPEFDADASRLRVSSPQARILEWVAELGDGDEIFLAYLSFSDQAVADALCSAEAAGVEVTMVLDKLSVRAEDVRDCGGEVFIRGNVGSVGFAHDKLLLVNPDEPGPADLDDEFIRMSFGSGNLSSGTHLHHENWNFLEVARDSFFVQSHLCLMEALIAEEHTAGKTAFSDFMAQCRSTIEAEPEDDITAYFIPALADRKALMGESVPSQADGAWFRMTDMMTLIAEADAIDIGAHRFSSTEMIDALVARLADETRPFHLRLIADDDLYWLSPLSPSRVRVVGLNSFFEADKLDELREADAGRGRFEEAYMETNHKARLLHHNKFLIWEGRGGARDALLFGSANLTGTGFDDNLENIYITDIPEVVAAFQAQYDLWWDGEGPLPEGHRVAPRATRAQDMPIEIFAPSEPGDPLEPEDRECGIRLAEVLYDGVGADDGQEWIKLYNSCDDARSLDGMSVGWGGSSYETGGVDLTGTIPGKQCFVVGGPTSGSHNGDPTFDLVTDLSPDLQNGGSIADGVALFAHRRREVDADSIPLDAVVYGESNASALLDAFGGVADPDVRGGEPGDSVVLVAPDTWAVASEPQPERCPTF